jgi:hypothetical protein
VTDLDPIDALEGRIGDCQADLGEAVGDALELAADLAAGNSGGDVRAISDCLGAAMLALDDVVTELGCLIDPPDDEPDEPEGD